MILDRRQVSYYYMLDMHPPIPRLNYAGTAGKGPSPRQSRAYMRL